MARRASARRPISSPSTPSAVSLSIPRHVWQFVASAIFYVVLWLSVAIYAPLALLTFPFSFRYRYWFISRWAAFHVWLLRVLCGVRHEIRGLAHLPRGPAILLAKHQSVWETLAFAIIFPPQTWVLKRELMWIPLFGWALGLLRPIAINRSKASAIQQVIDQGRDRLGSGIWVTVFPEGTRVAPGERRRWGQGGAVLAERTGYPVVPVAHNAGHYWPRRRFIKRPGTIQVVVGPTIESREMPAREILRRAEEWVEQTMRTLEDRAE